MKFATYFVFSVSLMLGTVYYAYYTYRQFYPTVLFLVSSKTAYIVIANMLFAIALLIARIFKTLFFGQLRDTEVELLVDTAKYTIPETCLALTIFRNELTPSVIALFGTLIFITLLHKLSKCRIEYLEQLLPMPIRSQLRAHLLLATLFFMDTAGTTMSVLYITNYGRSVIILFGFEFGLLIIYTLNLAIRFAIQIVDSRSDAGLPAKGLYIMLTDMICEIVKFLTYLCFFGLVFVYYGIPIHILRDLGMAFLSCQRKVVSFVKYLQLTRNLDSRFEDATPEDLAAAGHCLVCREDLAQGKKLRCGHVFHLDCLRMWLQHQQSCPLCRANISVSEAGPAAAAAAAARAAEVGAEDGEVPADVAAVPQQAGEAAAIPAAPQGQPAAAPHAHAPAPVVVQPRPAGHEHAAAAVADPARHRAAAHPSPVRPFSGISPLDHMSTPPAVVYNGPRVFGLPLPSTAQVAQALRSFPRFGVVVAEPDVSVLSDPMASGAEVRRITPGTIIFVTGRVMGGDGSSWLKAPDGWILECHPDHENPSDSRALYAVVPLMASQGPSPTSPSTASAVASAAPAARMRDREPHPAVRLPPHSPAARSVSPVRDGDRDGPESQSPSSDSRFYSRTVQKSRLLDMYDTKPSAEESGRKEGSSVVRRAPFSSVIDCAGESEEAEGEVASPSQRNGSSAVRMVAPQEGRGGDEEIDARLVELHELLTQAEREGYGELRAAVTTAVQQRGAQGGAAAESLRRRRVADMQSNMEQVTRNLVDLSQSVLACQKALQALAEDEDLHER